MSLRIRRKRFAAVLLAATLVFLAPVRVMHAQTAPIAIDSVAVVAGQLTITGSNFGAAPTVTLGGAALSLSGASDTSIVAALPGIESGLYELVVSRGGESDAEGTARTMIVI